MPWLTIDSHLSWSGHILNITKSFNSKLAFLKRSSFLPPTRHKGDLLQDNNPIGSVWDAGLGNMSGKQIITS